jgi:hypothetical protein
MAARQIRDLSQYPRPWFYRPEIYYGFIIFPPVWSVLTLRSPWHSGEGYRGIMVGGLAWFFIIASVVLSVRWVQEGGVVNLFIFVPGILLTLLTQVQWTAHRAHHGPPPTESEGSQERSSTVAPVATSKTENAEPGDEGGTGPAERDKAASEQSSPPAGYTPRRRRRRRRRPISRSADSATLC